MKKFSTIIICLLMVFTCTLTGCASFSIDKVKYYNEVLAKVGDEEITRYELLSAYNSYGQSYFVSQQGMSETDALNSTLDLLIDREAMYQYGVDHNDLYKPTAYQVNEMVKEIFKSLDSQMETNVKTSKQLLNIEVKENSSSSDTSSDTAYLREDYSYKKRAEIVKENGVDVIDFYITFNVGEPLKPLSKVASGGELSRIMLAFKTIYLQKNPLTFMIFDEIDSGVSGVTARKIAMKMHEIALNTQVLAITHLAQVAAIADTQLYILKEEENKRTKTIVKELSYEDRITEIAIMLSGLELSEGILQTAKMMLDSFKE